ncbi:Uncharacterized protein FKW44_010398 [Caligus rogercresseyi]|uniref:DUF659 domain-containing protein n=1 Tax=Caligus rogercresseyi TaxID=217165 RepID=A0A7T8HGH7_CALRO|nr:Uncharacterized protein FKW44_010398 [Caligus rogercresseyi]
MPNKNPALWIEEHGGLDIWNYEQTKNILKCQVCNLAILYKRRIQHVKTSRHQKGLLLREKNSNITTDCSGQSSFNIGLARMLAACNIPVTKIENPAFIQFMEEHTKKIIPSRRVITKIIEKESQHVIDNIKEKIKDEDLFLLLDESKDPKGRAMTAVLIGPLDGRFDSRPYLINVVDIKEANSKTIVTTVVDNLQNVLGEHFSPSRFKLLVTDGAAYCVKAAKSLKTSFPEMIHVTCLAHGIHRVAELVRFQFPNVNELISEVKKVFLKSPKRKNSFSALCQIPLPPEPIITPASYYAHNFSKVKEYIMELKEDSEAIKNSKKIFCQPNILDDLKFIDSNLRCIDTTITKLEERIPINDTEDDIRKNSGYMELKKLSEDGRLESNFLNAPIVNVDSERVFSFMKDINFPKRNKLSEKHVKDYLLIQWNFRFIQ